MASLVAPFLAFAQDVSVAAGVDVPACAILVVLFPTKSEAHSKSSWRDGEAGWNAVADHA